MNDHLTIQDINKAIEQLNRLYGELSEENKIALDVLIEKQIPKKPILQHDVTNVHINNGELPHEFKQIEKDNWHCPVCNSVVGERIILPKGKVHDQRMKIYCEKCGQRMEIE